MYVTNALASLAMYLVSNTCVAYAPVLATIYLSMKLLLELE